MSCTWPGNFIAAVYSTISKMLLTDVIKPIGRWGSRGFEQTPLLASKRFYTYCFKLYILSALLFEGGPCSSLANHRRPNGLVAAIELCKFVHDGPAWNVRLICLGHCDERNHVHKCVNKRRLRVHQLSI